MARSGLTINLTWNDKSMFHRFSESVRETASCVDELPDEFPELIFDGGRCLFRGVPIFQMRLGSMKSDCISMGVVAGFGLPLFAAEIIRLVPGAAVEWIDGWPILSPPKPRDGVSERVPVLPNGEAL